MADVFISYKRDERAAIEQIATTLRGLGLSVWFDASLTAGDSFSEEIDREAREAKAVLVCWSPTARESKWVRAEAMIGFEQDKLAACYVAGPDNFSPPVPFSGDHYDDVRTWLAAPSDVHAGWKSVLRRIGKLCGRADIETWGALDREVKPADLRAWLSKHGDTPLRPAAEALLHQREQHHADRARREQEIKDKRAQEKAEQQKAARARLLKAWRPWLIVGGVLTAALLAFAIYTFWPTGPARPVVGPPGRHTVEFADATIAARVNGRPIYQEEVREFAVARELIQPTEDLAVGSDAYLVTLEELIQVGLFALEAQRRGLDREPEVSRQIRGMTAESPIRDRILAGAMYEAIDREASDPEEVERLYNENASRLGGAEVRLAHIQLPSEEAAAAARRRLEQGERFEALAFELSTDRDSAPDGGDLGFRLESDLRSTVNEAVANASVNQVVGPIQVDSTWHLFRVVDRRATGSPSLEELRPRIIEWLRYQRMTELQERLEREYRVEVSASADMAQEAPAAAPANPVGPGGVTSP